MGKFYYAGVFAGIVIFLAIWLIIYILKEKKTGPAEYDERQQIARGKAYGNGYITLTFYLCAHGILQGRGIVWCEPMVGCILGVMLGAVVVALSAIKHDAFIALTENIKKRWLVNCAFILALILLGVVDLLEGKRLIVDGKLTECASTFLIAIFWTVVLVAELIHCRREKKLEGTEDEA